MTYVAPSTVTTLQTYTSAAHNVIVGDIISFRNMTGIVPPMCRLQKISDTTLTVGVGIDFGSALVDTDTMATSGTTITIKTAGVYEITCGLVIGGSSAFGNIPAFRPVLNGSASGPDSSLALSVGNYYTGVWIYTKSFSVSDTISMTPNYSSGGTVTALGSGSGGSNSYLQAKFIGSTS